MMSDELKRKAAERALGLVGPGMRIGLGTGSTAAHFVRALGAEIRARRLDVIGVPTSEATHRLAVECGVPLTTLDETPELDLTVDGADEVDRELRLIKGGGGALLREKIVAAASARMVVIADRTKLVDRLGAFPLPVEVVAFGHPATRLKLERALARLGLNGHVDLRGGEGAPTRTDSGNLIYDCRLGAIPEPERLAGMLAEIPGVVEHGLFIGMCAEAILADTDKIDILTAEQVRGSG